MQNILMAINMARASGRKLLAGIERYATAFAQWQAVMRPDEYLLEKSDGNDFWFRLDEIDGIISHVPSHPPKILNRLNIRKIKKPTVVFDAHQELVPGCSSLITDSHAIGTMAAEYFLGLGFSHFAYCGFRQLPWSQKRFIAYKQTLNENGISTVFEYQDDFSKTPQNSGQQLKISKWLKQLPQPVCVFTCNDDRAVFVLDACRIAGLNVPEEVAVLGVDNDELVCNLSSPSLSSIELDFENAGFLAAQHLNDLLQKKNENKIITVPPLEIISRRSTDVLALSDPDVAAALIFIRKNFQRPIQSADVVNATCLSRSELEKRFKRILKRTIKQEIERLRIDLIKKRLLNSNQPAYQIAAELEFTDPEHFPRYFKQATGKTPSAFRRKS